LRAAAEGACLGAYQFDKYFTGERAPKKRLLNVTFHKASGRPTPAETRAIARGSKVAAAVCLARDAVNEPPNELIPESLAKIARSIAKEGGFEVTVLDKQGIKKAGMHLHYAVGQGSANEPRFIHLRYQPRGAKKSIAFVGKGLTFDSGGLSIKPAAGMGEMKNDMGGAAAVLGLMAALAVLKPKVNVHGIIGAAENMPDGAAYRPGDIFKSLDGKTVEIINTDAEGRLVLADALSYANKLNPDLIVDAATLTGACLVALGKSCSAYYSADAALTRRFREAAHDAGEQFWHMPLLEDLREQLQSDCADLKHTGERWGGSITAALFLREFVGKSPWIHCDIAGPVVADHAQGVYPKGATGHPVLTFLSLVENFV
jgi:leucyl aminopeptidase